MNQQGNSLVGDSNEAETAKLIETKSYQDQRVDVGKADVSRRDVDLLDYVAFLRVDRIPEIDIPPKDSPDDERFFIFGFATVAYLWYRSQAAATFDLNPFCLQWNDLWGLLFIACFVWTRRATYLIYSVNPIRDLILVAIQWQNPSMASRDYQTELYRDIISAVVQLSIGLLVLHKVRKQPIGKGTKWADLIPGYPDTEAVSSTRRLTFMVIILALSTPFIFFVGAEIIRYDLYLSDSKLSEVMLKLCMAVPLGMSEEVSWREVVLRDSNNSLAAVIWGLDHLVAGEGEISNPYLYGIAAVSYAFTMGFIRLYKIPRYFNHASVEFIALQSLI